jgi:hypothetical protein
MIPTKHAALIFSTSFLLVAVLYFVDESVYSFKPLLVASELINFAWFVTLNTVLCLGIYAITLQTSFKKNSFGVALTGFAPVAMLIVWNLIY